MFLLFFNFSWIFFALPIRISFEPQREIPLSIVIMDFIVDFFFLIDCIMCSFFVPLLDEDGEFIFDRKQILKHSFSKPSCFLNLFTFLPMSYLKYTSGPGGIDDV